MTSTFLLDLRKLDFGVEKKVAEISAHAAAYYRIDNHSHYAFFLPEVNLENIPMELLKLQHYEKRAGSEFLFHYQQANLLFLPTSETPALCNGSTLETWNEELKGKCEAIYAGRKFYHGDEETFKRYGVLIKG